MQSARISLMLLIGFVFLIIPACIAAQVGEVDAPPQSYNASFVPLANVEGSKLATLYASRGTLADFVSNIFTMAISAGAILAVIRLSWAGYLYMTTDSWGSKGHAKEVIGDVVLGLLLLLGIWLILWQINPEILKLDFLNSLRQVQTSQTQTAPQNDTYTGGSGGYQDPSIDGQGVGGQPTGSGEMFSP